MLLSSSKLQLFFAPVLNYSVLFELDRNSLFSSILGCTLNQLENHSHNGGVQRKRKAEKKQTKNRLLKFFVRLLLEARKKKSLKYFLFEVGKCFVIIYS